MGSVTIRAWDNAIVGASQAAPAGVRGESTSALDGRDGCFRTVPATWRLVQSAESRLEGRFGSKHPAGIHGYGNIGALHCTNEELLELIRGRASDAPGSVGC